MFMQSIEDTAVEPALPSLDEGRVAGGVDGWLSIATGAGRQRARRAASCLLEPALGDRVLLARAGAHLFVLAVLERAGDAPSRLSVSGDLEIGVRGALSIVADEGIALRTPAAASLTSGVLALAAPETSLVARTLKLFASETEANVGRLQMLGRSVDAVVERLQLTAKNALRFVEGVDRTRAGELDVRAEGIARVHGHDAIITADQLVKLDGEQIHVG